MSEILCLGDSITDCSHLWDFPPLGNGYVYMLDQMLSSRKSDCLLTNRGYDGFTLQRLLLNLSQSPITKKYDMITLLIGINDISLMINTQPDPDAREKMLSDFLERYEQMIGLLSEHIYNADPGNLIVMEPFLFPVPMYRLHWFPVIEKMQLGIRTLSEYHKVTYLPLQTPFHQIYDSQGAYKITTDGVHLTDYGHKLLAQKLFQLINTNILQHKEGLQNDKRSD